MNRPSGLSALIAWGWLRTDHNWSSLVVVFAVVLLIAVVILAGGGSSTTEVVEIGSVELSISGPDASEDLPQNVTLSDDGILPARFSDAVDVTARYDISDEAIDSGDWSITLHQVLTRSTAHGTLWSLEGASQSSSTRADLTATLDVDALVSTRAEIDSRLGTRAGSVGVELRATVIAPDDHAYPTTVTAAIEPAGDHLRYEPLVREPVMARQTFDEDPSVWMGALAVVSALGLGGLLGGRALDRYPLTTGERRRLQMRWMWWNHRQQVVSLQEAYEPDDSIIVDDLEVLIQLATHSQRPILVGRCGTVGVTVDDTVYCWMGVAPFKTDDEQNAGPTCQ